MLEDICGTDLLQSVLDVLAIDLFSGTGKYSAVIDIIEPIYTVVQNAAVLLVFLYFCIGIFDKLSSDHFTMEQLLRQIALLFVAKYLIDYGMDLLELLFNLGLTLLSDVAAKIPATHRMLDANTAKSMLDQFEASLGLTGILKIFEGVIVFIWLLIPWALSWVMGLCVKVIMYSRVIEIYVKTVFSPIALADFYQGGLQSAGFKFLRGFLALAIQGAIIIVIVAIYSALFTVVVPTAGTNFFAFIGLYLAFLASAIMLMFKSLSVAKELTGA